MFISPSLIQSTLDLCFHKVSSCSQHLLIHAKSYFSFDFYLFSVPIIHDVHLHGFELFLNNLFVLEDASESTMIPLVNVCPKDP